VREGDTLAVTRIDGLARSLRDLQNVIHDLRQHRVALKATEQSIDTAPRQANAFSICWGFSLSLRLTYGASARWKASRGASIPY
jgi:TnpA family transposase